jgi:hypothetical protein
MVEERVRRAWTSDLQRLRAAGATFDELRAHAWTARSRADLADREAVFSFTFVWESPARLNPIEHSLGTDTIGVGRHLVTVSGLREAFLNCVHVLRQRATVPFPLLSRWIWLADRLVALGQVA